MTRFFSELVLSAGEDGTLEPFAEELPEPIVRPPSGRTARRRARRRLRREPAAPPRHLGSAPVPSVRREPPLPQLARPARLVVTVVDGDRNLRVGRAAVRLWGRSARTDASGVAEIVVPRRQGLNVTVGARGFSTRTVWEDFLALTEGDVARLPARSPVADVRRDRDTRADAVAHSPAAAVSNRLEPRARQPDRVPGGRRRRRRVHRQRTRDDSRDLDADREGAVAARHAARTRWRPRPLSSDRELVYHTMDGHVIVLDRATGRQLWETSFGSPIESSPIVQHGIDYFGAWNGRLYALDLRTHRLRWTRSLGAKITSSAAIADGRLFIGDYGGRALGVLASHRRDALGPLRERAHLRHACGARTAACSCRPRPAAR